MTMPEEAVFWAALADDPADEPARLAFADWLEERADPRAGWLRDPELAAFMRPGSADPTLALIEALQSEDHETWWPPIALLGRVGAPAVPALLARLDGLENLRIREPREDEQDDEENRKRPEHQPGVRREQPRPVLRCFLGRERERGENRRGESS